MATIRTEPNGNKTILVVMPNRKRKTIRLQTADQKLAGVASLRIQELADRARHGESHSPNLTNWLSRQPAKIRERLERAGLVQMRPEKRAAVEAENEQARLDRENPTLKAMTDRFLAAHSDRKEATYKTYDSAVKSLVKHFKPDRRIHSITRLDAREFISWLGNEGGHKGKKLSENTVRRRTGTVFQIFETAVEDDLLPKNPFRKFSKVVVPNPDKDHYVTIEEIEACIEEAPNAEWRAILALCRFGALRNPSETTRLRWIDVDTVNWERMVVHAPKTEHHKGKGQRVVPIFPDLQPYLKEAWDQAEEGAEYVINQGPTELAAKINMRSRMEKIITGAKLKVWPNLFNNMRGSAITDLILDTENVKQVAQWVGNSPEMIFNHYQKVTKHLEQIVLTRVEARTKRALKAAHATGTVGDGTGEYATETDDTDCADTRKTRDLPSEGFARIDGSGPVKHGQKTPEQKNGTRGGTLPPDWVTAIQASEALQLILQHWPDLSLVERMQIAGRVEQLASERTIV